MRTLTGTRHKTRRRQVTSILPVLITLVVAVPMVIPSTEATPGMPETIATQPQAVLAKTTDLGTPSRVVQEVSVPETAQPATTTNNKSQLGASYLNSHNDIPNINIFVYSSDSFAQEILKTLLNEKLNDKIYTTFRASFSNINMDRVTEISPKVSSTIMRFLNL